MPATNYTKRFSARWRRSFRTSPTARESLESHFLEWKSKSHSYVDMAAETWARGPRSPVEHPGLAVSVDFFSVLGVLRSLGALLREMIYPSHFGGQAGMVGQRLTLENSTCTVIGIMPSSFVFYPLPTEMWTLITPDSELDRNPTGMAWRSSDACWRARSIKAAASVSRPSR